MQGPAVDGTLAQYMTAQKRKAPLRQRPLIRKLFYGAPIRLAGTLVNANMPKAALAALALPNRYYKPNDRMLALRAKAERMQGNADAYSKAEVNRLHALVKRHCAQNNYPEILTCMTATICNI